LTALLLTTALASPLAAQQSGGDASAPPQEKSNLETLGAMQRTQGTTFTKVEQDSSSAEALREIVPNISVPDGFEASLYAVVPDARSMAVAPQGTVVFVGTRKDKLWSVVDRDRNMVADDVFDFAPSITFDIPNGPCFSPDGFLYVAERNRVLQFPAAEFFFESPDVAAGVVVPQGELIPPEEESFNHTARVCRVGPDGKLYISLGQPFNVPPPEKAELFNELGIGGMIRMNQDGSGREVYTNGIRNSVGHDFNPANGDLWFTDNQVDGMGDDIPPGEINRQTAQGQHFGFPYYGGGDTRTNEYEGEEPPADVVMPQVETTAHAADLGMRFYTGNSFPEKYRGGLFVAQHGSWNRTEPVGARVMFVPLDEEGNAGEIEVFADGWLDEETGTYRGRPMDIAFLPDGSILVSDDFAGAIWRIAYKGQ
jgi:glucose/arabinose dehydrogenase